MIKGLLTMVNGEKITFEVKELSQILRLFTKNAAISFLSYSHAVLSYSYINLYKYVVH